MSREEPTAREALHAQPRSAIITTTPLALVFTMLSVMGYWRQLPDVPETVSVKLKAFSIVQQATQDGGCHTVGLSGRPKDTHNMRRFIN